MARYLSQQFEYRDRFYHLEIGVDRIAALRNDLKIEIAARSVSINGQGAEAINVTLTLDLEAQQIVIEVEGEELGRISLDARGVAEADDMDDIGDTVWGVLQAHLLEGDGPATGFEQIMEQIPVGDPFLGCLIKGAISASVGQAIRCYQKMTPAEEGVRQKLRFIAQCMGKNVWGIFGRATARSLKCMARGGL